MKPDSRALTEAEFLRGLRKAVLTIDWVVLVSVPVGAFTLRDLDGYRHAWPQVLAYVVLVAIAVVETVLVMRKRSWGRQRVPAVVLALGASVMSALSLLPGHTLTADNWAFGTVGWTGVFLLLDRRLLTLVAFLAAHELITAAHLIGHGLPELADALNFVTGSIGTIGFPLASGIAAKVLRGVASRAEANRRATEASRTAERVQAARYAADQRRYRDLSVTAVPLLDGLATGTHDPDDPEVRRACWIEAAQMRRLFAEAEADAVPDPLVHELGQLVKAAQRRGVKAVLRTHGVVVSAPVEIRRALTAIPLAVLAVAAGRVQVTVFGEEDAVRVNVVSESEFVEIPDLTEYLVEVYVDSEGGTLWAETWWHTSPSRL